MGLFMQSIACAECLFTRTVFQQKLFLTQTPSLGVFSTRKCTTELPVGKDAKPQNPQVKRSSEKETEHQKPQQRKHGKNVKYQNSESGKGQKDIRYPRTNNTTSAQYTPNVKKHSRTFSKPEDKKIDRERLQIRAENKEFSRSQKHPYVRQPAWKKNGLLKHMLGNILYQDKHYIAFNKPAGVPIFSADRKHAEMWQQLPLDMIEHPDTQPSVMSILPDIKESLNLERLFLTSYQKDCKASLFHVMHSGVLLFVKSLQADKALRKYTQNVKSQKLESQKFWAVTVGLPTEDEGMRDIVLERRELHKTIMSFVTKDYSRKAWQNRSIMLPFISHKTLAKNSEVRCALVEIVPTKTMWDALQVYLTLQLSPVLGDHMYSSRVQYIMDKPTLVNAAVATPNPQKLPERLESELRMRFINAKDVIPMHLHCGQLIIPELNLEGKYAKKTLHRRWVTIRAPLPDYFNWTLDRLGLKVPDNLHTAGATEGSDNENVKDPPLTDGQPGHGFDGQSDQDFAAGHPEQSLADGQPDGALTDGQSDQALTDGHPGQGLIDDHLEQPLTAGLSERVTVKVEV